MPHAEHVPRVPATCVLFVLAALALFGGAPSARAGETGPVLVVTPEHLHLGEVYWGSSGRGEIVLENAGDETLVIDQIRSSCGCTVAPLAEDSRRLEPGAKVTVPVIMTPKGPATPLHKTLHVVSNDHRHPDVPVEVECDVKVGVETVPGYVLFRDLELGQVAETDLKVVSRDGEPFAIVSATVNGDLYALTFETGTEALEHVIHVRAGPIERRINPSCVLTVTTTHSRTPTLTINCNSMTAPALVTDPRYLLLGDVPAGGEREITVEVRRPHDPTPFESLEIVPFNMPELVVRTRRDEANPLLWHVAVTAPTARAGQNLNTPVRLVTELGEDAALTMLLGLRVTPEKP